MWHNHHILFTEKKQTTKLFLPCYIFLRIFYIELFLNFLHCYLMLHSWPRKHPAFHFKNQKEKWMKQYNRSFCSCGSHDGTSPRGNIRSLVLTQHYFYIPWHRIILTLLFHSTILSFSWHANSALALYKSNAICGIYTNTRELGNDT